MALDPRIDAIQAAQPGNDRDVAELYRRIRRLEASQRNPLVQASLPPLRFVGVEVGWANGFGNYGNGYASAAYRRGQDGYVDLEGMVAKAAASVTNELIFTLPADCWPATQHFHTTIASAGGVSNFAYVVVGTNGEVRVTYANSIVGLTPVNFVGLDEVRFRAV